MLKKHLWILNKLYITGGISYKDLGKEVEVTGILGNNS